MEQLLLLAFATSALSITLTKSHLGEAWRDWVMERNEWLGELFSCPYCLSHWVAVVLILLYGPAPLPPEHQYLNFFVSVMALVGMAAVISGMISILIKNSK